jgi:hypothetical protein
MISILAILVSFALLQAPVLAPVRTSGFNQSLSARRPSSEAYFHPELGEEIETFDPETIAPTLSDRIRALTFERMHLASAAPWWLGTPAEFGAHHLNAPSNREELSRWLAATLAYLKQELSRVSRGVTFELSIYDNAPSAPVAPLIV